MAVVLYRLPQRRANAYSDFMPASLMTLAHFWVS
jgi:hypothetical protein